VPPGANWNGSEEMYYTAEEYEAARDGTPLPKKAPKSSKKTATKPAATATSGGPAAGARPTAL
jgi:hypothetical protein